jgi:hypothetical protein
VWPFELADEIAATAGEIMLLRAEHAEDDCARRSRSTVRRRTRKNRQPNDDCQS